MDRANVQTPRHEAVEIVADAYAVQKQDRLPLPEALARVIERREFGKNFSPAPLEDTRPEVPGSRFWGAVRAAALMPTIGKCREEVFGSQNVPFETRDSANAWLGARARWGSGKSQRDALRRLDRFLEKAYKLLQTLGPAPQPYRISLHFEAHELEWGIYRYPVTDALVALKRHVTQIVRHTGWTEAESLDLVLLNVSPREEMRISGTVHRPPRGTEPTPKKLLYDWQTFRIEGVRPWHLHRAIFEGLAQQILQRTAFHEHRRDDLTLGDRLLLDSVVMVGRLPPSSRGQGFRVGRTEYWKQLCTAWVKLTGRRVRADALRKRWMRLEANRESVLKIIEDVIRSRHDESQGHQESTQAIVRHRIRKRSRKLQRRQDRGGNRQ